MPGSQSERHPAAALHKEKRFRRLWTYYDVVIFAEPAKIISWTTK